MTKESYNFGVDTEAKRLYTETSGMTARFTMIYFETDGNLIFDETKHNGEWYNSAECLQDKEIVKLLNELYIEREYWKQQAEKRFERIRELEEMIE